MTKRNPAERFFRFDRYTLYGLLAILLWSTTVAVVRSLSEQVGVLTSAVAVYGVGGILSVPTLFASGRPKTQIRSLPKLYLLGCGGLFVLYMLALYLAVGLATGHHQVLEVGLVNYLWPALTLLFSLPLLKKKARWTILPGTLLALLGVFLVLTQSISVTWSSVSKNLSSNPLVYLLGLVAAVSWALYSNLARRWGGPGSAGAVPLFMLATGLVLLLLRLMRPEHSLWTGRAIAETLFMGLATVAAYALWDVAMRKGDVVLVAACSYFTPLSSTLVSCLYLRIAAGVTLWSGCGLIILGSLISWASISERR